MEIYPGDSILVPEKTAHVNYMKEVRDITQILYQIAVTAGVAVPLFRVPSSGFCPLIPDT